MNCCLANTPLSDDENGWRKQAFSCIFLLIVCVRRFSLMQKHVKIVKVPNVYNVLHKTLLEVMRIILIVT